MRLDIFSVLSFLLCLNISISYAQTESSDEIAIYTPELEYLQNGTSSFDLIYDFDVDDYQFMQTSQKTTLWLTPNCEKRKIVKTLSKNSLVKTYKYFPQKGVFAAQFENNWGFLKKSDLAASSKCTQPLFKNDLDAPPILLNSLTAKYPAKAKKAGVSGNVILKVHISNTGAVTHISIEKSIPLLDTAALKAVKKLRFKPAKKFGSPVDSWLRFPVVFILNDD